MRMVIQIPLTTLLYLNTSLKSSLRPFLHDLGILWNCLHVLLLQLVLFITAPSTLHEASLWLVCSEVVTRMNWQAVTAIHLYPPALYPGIECLICFLTGHLTLCLSLWKLVNHSFFSADDPSVPPPSSSC